MTTTVKGLLEAANRAVKRISPAEANALAATRDVLFLDVRDPPEAASGRVKGALNVSRGMLEFRADSDLPSHDVELRKDRPIVLYCGTGGRSALAGKVLQDMGYREVYNLGAFKDWMEAGFETEAD